MDNDEVLGHLLKIESEAAALVNDAQAEADRRVLEAEKQNHAAYEERYRREGERLEHEYQALKEKIRQQYQTELESYSNKITSLHVDVNRFSALLDRLVAEEA
jgi:F0F1-type ATP synthase membrane subunit b/b'